jgi:hypothetical protein
LAGQDAERSWILAEKGRSFRRLGLGGAGSAGAGNFMASAAGLRPNHYETLGVSPGATDSEIAQAFARMMGMFGVRPVSVAAQLSVAFEVLRNPSKRRDYDRALGLTRDPEPLPWSVGGIARSSPGLIGSAWSGLGEQVTRSPAPKAVEAPAEAPTPEPRIASFIASSLRDPPKGDVPEIAAEPGPREGDDASIDWRRPALAGAALVLAAGLIGTMAGLSVTGSESAAPGANVTSDLPAARPSPSVAAASPSAPAIAETATVVPVEKHAGRRLGRHSFAQKALDQAPSLAIHDQPQADLASDATAADPLAPEPAADAATMPLSNSVVARTIERIGYSCGTVVSTTAVEASGVYTVTCSSGHTYRAAPSHGRYRFRRSG